jgi:hypothetical protein
MPGELLVFWFALSTLAFVALLAVPVIVALHTDDPKRKRTALRVLRILRGGGR